MKNKQFAVIGLGQLGGSICQEFSNMGYEVLAIDSDLDKVNDYAHIATQAVQADATDEKVLQALGIRNFDHVIVAIGRDIQASILTTLLLKESGVKEIWAKAQNDYHEKILKKLGADKIIRPEVEIGYRIAHLATANKILDYIELSRDYSIIEIEVTDRIIGKSIMEMDVRANYGCNVIAIKRNRKVLVTDIGTLKLKRDDVLLIIGKSEDLERFENEGI
ncbi:TrkA family potassium uptake protein [Sporolactobacillus sp. THM7-7]|nr:TrkA family potassium uptake protein [Sporolactobacillus sp. THM7-7]